MEESHLESKLLKDTLELFINRPRTLTVDVINKEEPLLTLGWLKAFNTSENLDPSVKRTETLYNYLLKKKNEAELQKEAKNEKN